MTSAGREQGTARAGGAGRAGARQRAAAHAGRARQRARRASRAHRRGRAGRRSRAAILRWSLVGTLAAAAALVAVVVVRSGRAHAPAAAPALAYQIEGGSLVDGGYLRESGGAASSCSSPRGRSSS